MPHVASSRHSLSRRSGAQSVERAMRLLQIIATKGRQGLALGEVAAEADLDPATARRMLLVLIGAGFVSQEAGSRRYHLGLQFFSLAAAAANRFDLSETRRATLSRLSRATGAAAIWLVRDGDDIVCVDGVHAAGQPAALDIGARRPLGADSYGIALLSLLSEADCAIILARNALRLTQGGVRNLREIHERIARARRIGYAANYDMPWSGCSLAVAIGDRDGQPESVLGLSAPSFQPPAVANLVAIVTGQLRAYQDAASRLPAAPADRRNRVRRRPALFVELDISHCETGRRT